MNAYNLSTLDSITIFAIKNEQISDFILLICSFFLPALSYHYLFDLFLTNREFKLSLINSLANHIVCTPFQSGFYTRNTEGSKFCSEWIPRTGSVFRAPIR
jgi:hypothetical protein